MHEDDGLKVVEHLLRLDSILQLELRHFEGCRAQLRQHLFEARHIFVALVIEAAHNADELWRQRNELKKVTAAAHGVKLILLEITDMLVIVTLFI